MSFSINDDEKNYPFTFKKHDVYVWTNIFNLLFIGTKRILLIMIYMFIMLFFYLFKNFNFVDKRKDKFLKYLSSQILQFFSFVTNIKNNIEISNNNIIFINSSTFFDYLVANSIINDAIFITELDPEQIVFVDYFFNNKIINLNNFKYKDEYKNKNLVFFSENCFSKNDVLLKLDSNIFDLKREILPIYFEYPEESCWCENNQNIIDYLIAHLLRKKTEIKIHIYEKYNPSKNDLDNIEQFSDNFRKYYSSLSKVKLSKLSKKDLINN